MNLHNLNDDTRQVEQQVEKKGLLEGIKDYLTFKSVVIALPILVKLGLIYWNCYCAKKSKIAIQESASANAMRERSNVSFYRIKEQDNAAKNKRDEISAQSEADLRKIKAANEAKLAELDKRHQTRMEIAQKKNNPVDTSKEQVESYAEAKSNGSLSKRKERCLGFPYFKIGYSRGVIGPTDVGKSTYTFQEGIAIARGECRVPLTADWLPIPPVHVVYFSLEQTYEEIEQYWGAEIEPVKSHFHLYCGQISPAQIVEIVKEYLDVSNEYGVVLYIDNEGKLERYAHYKEIGKMDRELENIRQTSFKSAHPLTIVKVYHTSSKYDKTKPFDINSVRGDKNNVNLNNDVMFITFTSLGDDKRMVGHLKNKHNQRGCVNIVEFAGTEVDQFRYVGKAKEVDVLCSKNPNDDTTTAAVVFDPHKPGRKPTITLEEAQRLQDMVTSGEKTWAKVQQETGHSKSKVKECIRSQKLKA